MSNFKFIRSQIQSGKLAIVDRIERQLSSGGGRGRAAEAHAKPPFELKKRRLQTLEAEEVLGKKNGRQSVVRNVGNFVRNVGRRFRVGHTDAIKFNGQ